MSLTTDIKTIVNTKFPDATYALSSWFNANRDSYDIAEMTVEKPLIILNNELPTDKEIQENVNILANTRIMMWFLTQGDVYKTDIEMNTAIEALTLIADRVYINIFQLNSIRLKGSELFKYRITPKFKIWNSVLIGIEVEARVKENQIRNFCTS